MLFYIACFIATLQVKLLYPPTIWQGLLLGTTMAKSAKYFPEIVSFSKQKKKNHTFIALQFTHYNLSQPHEKRKPKTSDQGHGKGVQCQGGRVSGWPLIFGPSTTSVDV